MRAGFFVLAFMAVTGPALAQPVLNNEPYCRHYAEFNAYKYPDKPYQALTVCRIVEGSAQQALAGAWGGLPEQSRRICLQRTYAQGQPSYEALWHCVEAEVTRSLQGEPNYSFYPNGMVDPASVERGLTLPECLA